MNISNLIITIADKNPNLVLFEQGESKVTAKEFKKKILEIGFTLTKYGLVPGDKVCIHLDRCIDAVVYIYAVLYIGCIYIPLDINEAEERLEFIVNDVDAKLIITSLETKEKWAKNSDWLNINKIKLRHPTKDFISCLNVSLAAILYTSGSTGRPKGVAISHKAIYSTVVTQSEAFDTFSLSRVASLTPFSFALSLFDLFTVSYSEATLVFFPQNLLSSPNKISNWLSINNINGWCTVPTVLILWSEWCSIDQNILIKLQTVIFAGEVMNVSTLHKLISSIPHTTFYNLYGSTEVNASCYWKVCRNRLPSLTYPPIGKPTSKCNLKVDEFNSELLVRGDSMFAGYWNNNTLTPHEGFFRTGDIVELNELDEYVCKGRVSRMFKHFGYRIHPFEIETCILSFSEVQECCVIQSKEKLPKIIAFIVLKKEGAERSISRMNLKTKLPKYMLPDQIVYLPKLPRLNNRKIAIQKLHELYNN